MKVNNWNKILKSTAHKDLILIKIKISQGKKLPKFKNHFRRNRMIFTNLSSPLFWLSFSCYWPIYRLFFGTRTTRIAN
jgi:hypothetical protein